MFYYLNGTITLLDANLCGCGLRRRGLCVSYNKLYACPTPAGKACKTFHLLQHQGGCLRHLRLFHTRGTELLRAASRCDGRGPEGGAAILSVVSPEQLTLAVMTQDDKTITMAQGVGKKLAQRIILELKDKLGASQLELNTAEFAGAGVLARGSKAAEATAALVGLGYSQTEAAAALKGIDIENLSIEDVIRRALRAAAQQ